MSTNRRGRGKAQFNGGAHMRATAPARVVAPARKRRFGLWTAILIVAIVVFLAAAFALGSILLTYHEGQKSYDDVADKAFLSDSALSDASGISLADLTVDWDVLLAINRHGRVDLHPGHERELPHRPCARVESRQVPHR